MDFRVASAGTGSDVESMGGYVHRKGKKVASMVLQQSSRQSTLTLVKTTEALPPQPYSRIADECGVQSQTRVAIRSIKKKETRRMVRLEARIRTSRQGAVE